jgi:hypothetical protein
VHEASARLGRDDRAQLIDAGVAARPTVGAAAFGVHAAPHASAGMTRGR